jgi:hypothetical protein
MLQTRVSIYNIGLPEDSDLKEMTDMTAPFLLVMLTVGFHMQVFMREHDRCRLGIMTDVTALFLLIVPHLMIAAVIAAIVTIPMCNLNSTSSGWGYLIVNVLLVQLCADGMVLTIAAMVRDNATQVFGNTLLSRCFRRLFLGAYPTYLVPTYLGSSLHVLVSHQISLSGWTDVMIICLFYSTGPCLHT